MVTFTEDRITNIFQNFTNKKIAIIGDLMLDCYIWGKVNRISPEAPVPVVEVKEETYMFGGAANVALNISSLGGIPILIGIMGNDREGQIFNKLLDEYSFMKDGIIFSNERKSTVKTRIIAHAQQVVRIDKEEKSDISIDNENHIMKFLHSIQKDLSAIILQDYNKGVLTKTLISKVINFAVRNNIKITVDPKFKNFFEYKNVTLFKPNLKESEDALGVKIDTEEDVIKAGFDIQKRLNAKNVLITRSEKGVTIFSEDGESFTLPTKARKVADVSGAGDTVIATITLSLAAGATIKEAATIANFAAGLVCEETGIVPIDKNNLFEQLPKGKF